MRAGAGRAPASGRSPGARRSENAAARVPPPENASPTRTSSPAVGSVRLAANASSALPCDRLVVRVADAQASRNPPARPQARRRAQSVRRCLTPPRQLTQPPGPEPARWRVLCPLDGYLSAPGASSAQQLNSHLPIMVYARIPAFSWLTRRPLARRRQAHHVSGVNRPAASSITWPSENSVSSSNGRPISCKPERQALRRRARPAPRCPAGPPCSPSP